MFRRQSLILFLLLFIFAVSCKHKPSHKEALDYYVIVHLQTKEVRSIVRGFSTELSQLIKQYSSLRKDSFFNQQTFDSLQNEFYYLVMQVDKRMKILEELPSSKRYLYLKNAAMNYIKDTRSILIKDVFKIINTYKTVSYKANKPDKVYIEMFKLRKLILISDEEFYKTVSELFRKHYSITDNELINYSL